MVQKTMSFVVLLIVALFCVSGSSFAEISWIDNQNYALSLTPSLRIDVVSLKNNIDLDSKNKDDSTTYLGYDWSLATDLKWKDNGPELFLKLGSYGPYGYDAPLFVHNTLKTSTDRIEKYRDDDLLPRIQEFWGDFPLVPSLRLKAGLYAYQVAEGLSLTGDYENYGLALQYEQEENRLGFYYSKPDLMRQSYLGKRPSQEKIQGVNYEHAKADFLAVDSSMTFKGIALKPYSGLLLDRTEGKRSSLFTASTHKDILGTLGLWASKDINKLTLTGEAARNYGKAKSSDETYKDIEHTGFLVYTDATYTFQRFSPHTRFLYASGNKVTTDMVNNGDSTLLSGKNRAFSVYSPFNTTIADAHYPSFSNVPLVAMGNGYGLNYGVPRPGTFGDPALHDNLILFGFGTAYALSEKISLALDWWYLRSAQNGVGTFNGTAKELSNDLGNEVDASLMVTINPRVSVNLSMGYFLPGKFYKELRDDTNGSLYTPFGRGDGKADGAYQIEFNLTFSF